jgi:hypothetical protein
MLAGTQKQIGWELLIEYVISFSQIAMNVTSLKVTSKGETKVLIFCTVTNRPLSGSRHLKMIHVGVAGWLGPSKTSKIFNYQSK